MEANAWFSFRITLWRPPTNPTSLRRNAVCSAGKPCRAISSNNWLNLSVEAHRPRNRSFSECRRLLLISRLRIFRFNAAL